MTDGAHPIPILRSFDEAKAKAFYCDFLGFRVDCSRTDIVGMGCNAGLNGLNPASAWAAANPGRLALMVCCEVNSALYVYDEDLTTGVVNSLFGDGTAAVALRASARRWWCGLFGLLETIPASPGRAAGTHGKPRQPRGTTRDVGVV